MHGADWRAQEAIWRIVINNEQTQRLIVAICGAGSVDPQEFPAGDDRFFALLGSEHGKAPCRMLSTYPGMFGRKSISGVRVFPDGGLRDRPNLCWFLEQAAPPSPTPAPALPATPDRPLSRKEARQYKKRLSSRASPVPRHADLPVSPLARPEPFGADVNLSPSDPGMSGKAQPIPLGVSLYGTANC